MAKPVRSCTLLCHHCSCRILALLLAAISGSGSDTSRRSVELWIWSGAGAPFSAAPQCAVCALLNATDDSCVAHPCIEPAGERCIKGQSCDFLPPIVAAALEKEEVPFITGVIAYMGIGLTCGGLVPTCNTSTISRPDPSAYRRARATAQSLHRRGIAFSAMSNGMSVTQIRSFLYNETSVASWVREAVADAVEYGLVSWLFHLPPTHCVLFPGALIEPSNLCPGVPLIAPCDCHRMATTSIGSGLPTHGGRMRSSTQPF